MQVAGMILGCLLLGQARTCSFPCRPAGKGSPAVLEPAINGGNRHRTIAGHDLRTPVVEPGGRTAGSVRRKWSPMRSSCRPAATLTGQPLDVVQRVGGDAGPPPAVGDDAGVLASGAGGGRVSLLPGPCRAAGTHQARRRRAGVVAACPGVGRGDASPGGVGGDQRPVRIGQTAAAARRRAAAAAGRPSARGSLSDELPGAVRGANAARAGRADGADPADPAARRSTSRRRRFRRPRTCWPPPPTSNRAAERRGRRGGVQPGVAAAAAGVHAHRVRLQSQHRRIRFGRGGPRGKSAGAGGHLDWPVQPGSAARRWRETCSRRQPASRSPARRRQPSAGTPTLAPPRDAGKKNEPTLAPPRDGVRPRQQRTSRRWRRRATRFSRWARTSRRWRRRAREPPPASRRQLEDKPLVPVEQPAAALAVASAADGQ